MCKKSPERNLERKELWNEGMNEERKWKTGSKKEVNKQRKKEMSR